MSYNSVLLRGGAQRSPRADFKFVVLNQEPPLKAQSGVFRRTLVASLRPLGGTVLGTLQGWYHGSLLRLILLETRSACYRISSSRCRRTALNFAEVRRSLPQVPCSDSQNEMQFCTASILALSVERPYLTLADCRLFAEGFFLAQKWYAHVGMLDRNAQRDSSLHTPDRSKSMPDSVREVGSNLPSMS